MATQKLRKSRTTDAILAASRELFLSQGLEVTSVEQIAERAGVSRATLFNHYRGKGAILATLAGELEPRLLQLLDHYLAKPLSSGERLQQLFDYAGRVLVQTAPLTRLLLAHGSQGAGFESLRREFHRLVISGQRQGDIREDLQAGELGDLVYLSFMAALLNWCDNEGDALDQALHRRVETLQILLAQNQPGPSA